MSYIYVTSDGKGFQITTDPHRNFKLSHILSFAIYYYLIKSTDDHTSLNNLLTTVNSTINLNSAVKPDIYYHDSDQFIAHCNQSMVINDAIKVVIDYPKEFAIYLTNPVIDNFTDTSTFGTSIFIQDTINRGIGSYIVKGNESITLTDANGNEINFVPRSLRPLITDSIPDFHNVDVSFMNSTVNSVTATLRSRIRSLKSNNEEIAKKKYNEGYNAGISVLTSLPEGWNVINIPGKLDKYFAWHGLIHPHYISKNSKIYKLPEEISNLFFITDIAVPVSDQLYNILGKGLFPHISSGATIDDTPSTTQSWGSTCIGDLGGKPFAQLGDIISQMDIINVNSMYGGVASKMIHYLMSSSKFTLNDYGIYYEGTENKFTSYDFILNDKWKVVLKYAGRITDESSSSEVSTHKIWHSS